MPGHCASIVKTKVTISTTETTEATSTITASTTKTPVVTIRHTVPAAIRRQQIDVSTVLITLDIYSY